MELVHPGVGWSCSYALDCSEESMLMVISSSSSCTLVLVPDSSPRTCGGVEYSFGGFSEWEDSEGSSFFCFPQRNLGAVIPFRRAPSSSRGPIEDRFVFAIVFPQVFFPIKMERPSRAMIFL